MPTAPLDKQTILDLDPWLEQEVAPIIHRHDLFRKWKDNIQDTEGGYDAFTQGYHKMGLNVQKDNSVIYREWAPNAVEAVFIGDFSECFPSVFSCNRAIFSDRVFALQTGGTANHIP